MLTIETKRIEISQVFKRKIEMLGKFTNTNPTILSGEIMNIKGTNVAYTKPHQVIINNNIYLIFEESDDVFINTHNTKIKHKDLEDFIKSNKDLTNES